MKPQDSTRVYSVAAARSRLPALVHSVEEGGPIELTRRGQPVAVLLSVEDYRGMRREAVDFWGALSKFRAETDLEGLDIDEVWADVRDPYPGREPIL